MNETPSGITEEVATTQAETTQESVTAAPQVEQTSRLKKILQKLHLSKTPTPAIEVKPPLAPGSEGRAVINREQLQQKLQQNPT